MNNDLEMSPQILELGETPSADSQGLPMPDQSRDEVKRKAMEKTCAPKPPAGEARFSPDKKHSTGTPWQKFKIGEALDGTVKQETLAAGLGSLNLASNLKHKSAPKRSLPAGNRIPVELLDKIWGYWSRSGGVSLASLCKVALVNKVFYKYFTAQELWDKVNLSAEKHLLVLLPSNITHNVMDSVALTQWYSNLIVFSAFYGVYQRLLSELPAEIWRHRTLLLRVLKTKNSSQLAVAPSYEDFKPYANDKEVAMLFLERIPVSDCLKHLSRELWADDEVVLAAVRRFPGAICYCHYSLLNDRNFVKRVIEANCNCIEYLGDYRDDTELIILASRRSQNALKFARNQAYQDIKRIGSYTQSIEPVPSLGQICRLCERDGICKTCSQKSTTTSSPYYQHGARSKRP